ncbi:hypothetical protein ACJJID_04730 [Microbulbifer sp. CnH-101-G]|uniref:hypothetical protein n=1 Tax=Microbulbifer sp. CnH-101-G TaxID=3243393 RepID=UPI004039284E
MLGNDGITEIECIVGDGIINGLCRLATVVIPALTLREFWNNLLAEKAGDMMALGGQGGIDCEGDQYP